MTPRTQDALAGVAGTMVWAAVEPLDRRLFAWDYSDVAMLGKAVTRSRAWPIVGVAMHAANGAVFGLAFHALRRRSSLPTRRLAFAFAMTENFALFPLSIVVDRKHPARGEAGVAPLWNGRALLQATARHAVFGLVLGRLAARR